MTGPEHYKAAERLVAHSQSHTDQGNGADDKIAELAAAQAQVHATLALAAAAAIPAVKDWLGDEDRSGLGWTEVTS